MSVDLTGKIRPLRIRFLDQTDLPRSIPLLEALLALDRFVHLRMQLEVDERMHAVLLGEAVYRIGAMRFDAG